MYSVAVYATPMPWPLQFAVHAWFVIGRGSQVDRYEVWAVLGRLTGETVVVNGIDPYEGFRTSFLYNLESPKKKGSVAEISSISGEEGSVAHKVYDAVVASKYEYPAIGRYRMWPGPNSNTYVAWLIKQFPEAGLFLPKNAYGQHYKLR